MQIIFLTLLFLLLPGVLSGESSNMLQEWEQHVPQKQKALLPQWRFSAWGYSPSRQAPVRSYKTEIKNGKVTVTLENKHYARSANLLVRTLPLKESENGLYKFSISAVNTQPAKALLRLKLSCYGAAPSSREKCFTVTGKEEVFSLSLKVPAKNKSLSIQICLSGPGKVQLSQGHLSLQEQSDSSKVQLTIPQETFLLPERTPVLFPVKLPSSRPLSADAFVTVTFPWGVRLINISAPATGEKSTLQVGKSTTTRLKIPAKRSVSNNCLYLLLGSDLPASDLLHSGTLSYEDPKGKSEEYSFTIQVVKDQSTLPPRFFRIMLDGALKVAPREISDDSDNALLRSGANILNAPALTIPHRTLRNARIRQYCYLPISQAPPRQHCYYAMIRNESFWEKHFIPAIRRHILRQQRSYVEALVCDSYLGQRKGIECLCALCRAELVDFAPKLPPQAVINYSPALLNSRFSKELRRFRYARLSALLEAARYQLPTGSTAFFRTPQLIPCRSSTQILTLNSPPPPSAEAIIDFYQGSTLPDGARYNGAVNFVMYEKVRKKMSSFLSKRRLTARLAPALRNMKPEELQFEILNILFSGFSGAWIALPPGAGWEYHKIIARTSSLIREYENFFRRGKKAASAWHLSQGNSTLELPPIPGPGLYRQEIPAQVPALQLHVWQYGRDTLTAVGNFSDTVRTCTLSNKKLSPKKEAVIDQKKYSGKELAEEGIELTIPPFTWKFLKISNP